MTIPAGISAEIWERADILCDQFRDVADDRELIARVLIATGQGGDDKPGITHEQAKCLAFVRDFQSQNNGVSPSYDEIAQALGRTKSNVHDFLHRMADRGVIRLATRARSITILARA